jgi:hypothetical protein
MIHRYGDDARTHATLNGAALLAGGDREGLMIWLTIGREIARLQSKPGRPETLH